MSDVGDAIRKALGVKPVRSLGVSAKPAATAKFASRIVGGDLYLAVEDCPVVTVYRAGAREPEQIDLRKQVGGDWSPPQSATKETQLLMPWCDATRYAYCRIF
jgi:hypothetical protein